MAHENATVPMSIFTYEEFMLSGRERVSESWRFNAKINISDVWPKK